MYVKVMYSFRLENGVYQIIYTCIPSNFKFRNTKCLRLNHSVNGLDIYIEPWTYRGNSI